MLGGILHHSGSLTHEIRARAGHAWTALLSRKRRLFGQKSIAIRDKMLLRSLVCTVLFFGAGTWPSVPERDVRRLMTGYAGLCRAVLRPFKGDVNKLTEDRVLALTEAPSLTACLHAERLTYFRSFFDLGVDQSVGTGACGRWAAFASTSIEWMWTHTEGFCEFHTGEDAWHVWTKSARTPERGRDESDVLLTRRSARRC